MSFIGSVRVPRFFRGNDFLLQYFDRSLWKFFRSKCCIQIPSRSVSCTGGWVQLIAVKETLTIVASLVVYCCATKNVIVTSQWLYTMLPLYSSVSVQKKPLHNRPLETDHVHNRPVHNKPVHNRPRTVARKFSIGRLCGSARGGCVCAGGGLDIIKLTKTPLFYSISRFNLRGLGALFGGAKPTKALCT